MFEHSDILTKETHSAHGFDYCMWVVGSRETKKLTSFISRLSKDGADPVGIQAITADETYGIDNLVQQSISEIDENKEGIYTA